MTASVRASGTRTECRLLRCARQHEWLIGVAGAQLPMLDQVARQRHLGAVDLGCHRDLDLVVAGRDMGVVARLVEVL